MHELWGSDSPVVNPITVRTALLDSRESWDIFHYQRIIHEYNILSALHDDNDERESNEKLFKDLLDLESDRNKENFIHYADSDSDFTHYDDDSDGNSDYTEEGPTRKYTASGFFSEFFTGDDEHFNEERKYFEKHTKDLFGDAPT